MEFKFRAVDEEASTHQGRSSSFSNFSEQSLQAPSGSGHSNTEFFRNPFDVREAIQREIEKERIREEIIAAEIGRRRLLEAEVRREMLMEREMRLQRGDGFSFPSVPRFDRRPPNLHQSEGRSLEERLALSLEERIALSLKERLVHTARREIGPVKMTPFQRNAEPRISELKPPSEVSKEKVLLRNAEPRISEVKPPLEVSKDNIIVLAKPGANLSGAKRKAETPPLTGATDLSLIVSKKKPKEEWSCAICQVSATSERALSDHLQGKKHKSKEAGLIAQRTGKNFGIGLFPKKTVKPTTDNPSSQPGRKIGKELVQVNQENSSKKKTWEGRREMQKTVGENKKNKFKFWCEMCQAGAFSEKVMNNHKKGKKHRSGLLQQIIQSGGAVPNARVVGPTEKTNDEEEVFAEDGKEDAWESSDPSVDGVV